MSHIMAQVNKERGFLMRLYKLHGLIGITNRQGIMTDWRHDHLKGNGQYGRSISLL